MTGAYDQEQMHFQRITITMQQPEPAEVTVDESPVFQAGEKNKRLEINSAYENVSRA